MTIDMETLAERIRENDNFLILTHANPDGDTLGSGFALLHSLRSLNKKVRLINNDIIPEKYSFLYSDVLMDELENEYIVSVDVADRKLLGDRVNEQYGDMVDLAIDHHGTNRLFAKETYVEPESASASEIIFSLAKALGIDINKTIADCLYTGCSTDTGCFRYSNVTSRTHRIAAELIDCGADHTAIDVKMFETKKMSNIMLEKMSLEGLELHMDGKVAIIKVTLDMLRDSGTTEADCDAVCALARQIDGVKIGVTLKEKEGGIISASLRTHEGYDASAICAHFGGGGHNRAAGCKITGKIDEVKNMILDYIEKEYFEEKKH